MLRGPAGWVSLNVLKVSMLLIAMYMFDFVLVQLIKRPTCRETVPCQRHWQNKPSGDGTYVKNKCLVMNIWWESTMFDMWVFCWFTPQMSHMHKYVVVVIFHLYNLCAFLITERFGEFSHGIAASQYCLLHEEHLSLSVSVTICQYHHLSVSLSVISCDTHWQLGVSLYNWLSERLHTDNVSAAYDSSPCL